jgi:glycosyltransferase involved in cell wall biosynthesis
MGKILILIAAFDNGGAENQAVRDANELSLAGHRVTLAYAMDGELRVYLSQSVNTVMIKNGWKGILEMLKLLSHQRFDIIFSHSPWSHNVVFLPALLTAHKWVLFAHGMNLWRKGITLKMYRLVAYCAWRIVVTSEASIKIRSEREKINPIKLIKFYNSYHKHNAAIVDRIDHTANQKFVIGCVARFERVKQLKLFVELCNIMIGKGMSDFKIILIGKGDTWGSVKELIKTKKLNRFFELPGYVDDLTNWYSQFDIFILPSKSEDLSVSLIEASSYGIPSVAFKVGGNSEVIDDGITGYLVEPYNIKEMASKLCYLYKNLDVLENMGLKAKQRSENEFSQEKRLLNLESLLKLSL